ncbi:MAG TPA: FHA domain-containing protein, partial [Pyrinomonadaceae bacterium]|nr:FHA domain-containing protein [Pyrinomonadaceae bacterium]
MQSTFVIIREDLQVDPITIVGDSLLIGRLPTCELLLNHPSVSRLQAGLTHVEDDYFVRNLKPGNPITLNGHPVEEYTALTAGDVLGIGPFALNVDFLEEALALKVAIQIAASPEDALVRRETSAEFWDLPTTSNLSLPGTPSKPQTPAHRKSRTRKPKPGAASSKALDVFWDKRITAATKTMKLSPLFPLLNRPGGKAQSIWSSTTDLKPKSHFLSILIVAGVVALLAIAGAWFYGRAFAPGSISESHNRASLSLSPAIATHANS